MTDYLPHARYENYGPAWRVSWLAGNASGRTPDSKAVTSQAFAMGYLEKLIAHLVIDFGG